MPAVNWVQQRPTEHSATYIAIHPGGVKSAHEVNAERAKTDFAELCEELSHASHASRKHAKIQSWRSKWGATADVEKADERDISIEPFDPESTLRGKKAEEEVAGIKAKRIGVYWDEPFLLSHYESLSLADHFWLISHARPPNGYVGT